VQFQDLSGSNTLVQLELVLYVRAHIVSLRKGFQKGQKLEQASAQIANMTPQGRRERERERE